jgi:hypothetical protein
MDRTRSDAFRLLQPYSAARWDGAPEDGQSYTLSFVLNGQIVSTIPFSVTVVEGGDPFDPKTTWMLDGSSRTHAFFRHETARPDYQLYFHAWVGPDEVTVSGLVEVSIRRAGEEVAWAYTHVSPVGGRQNVDYRLVTPANRSDDRSPIAKNWTRADVRPEPYEIVLLSEGQTFRTMTVEGGDGVFVANSLSDTATERTSFLTPRSRWYDGSHSRTSRYWVVNE